MPLKQLNPIMSLIIDLLFGKPLENAAFFYHCSRKINSIIFLCTFKNILQQILGIFF